MKGRNYLTSLCFLGLCLLFCCLYLGFSAHSASADVLGASCLAPFKVDHSGFDFQSAGLTDDIIDRIIKIFRAIVQAVIDLQCKLYRLFGFRCG